jgi:hypothetical protein
MLEATQLAVILMVGIVERSEPGQDNTRLRKGIARFAPGATILFP